MDCRWMFRGLPFVVLLSAAVFQDVQTVEIKVVKIPKVVRDGTEDPVILDCDYEMGKSTNTGLVIKWYVNKDLLYQWIYGKPPTASDEFHKYVDATYKASDNPNTMYRAVKLVRPGHELSGDYRCLVSTQDDEDEAHDRMLVYSPEKDFRIMHISKQHAETNYLFVTCLAKRVYPQPKLTIRMNKKPINGQKVDAKKRKDDFYDVEAGAKMETEALALPFKLQCELSIPEANYSSIREFVYNGGDLPRLSILAVIIVFIACNKQ